MARCPILITGNISKVIAQGDFIRQIQQRLIAFGHDPGPVDGLYGPKTAAALRAFQVSHAATFPDQAWSQVLPGGVAVAACATYRELGLPCDEVYCDIGIIAAWLGDTAKAAAICGAVALAADRGVISLRCGGGGPGGITLPGLPPTTPLPGGTSVPTWAVVAGGVAVAAVVGTLVYVAVRRGRRG